MSAGKILNTSNALYANITRALSLDTVLPQLRALDGGIDAPLISSLATTATTQTWTSDQGIARNTNNWFGFNTFSIKKYDLANNLLVTNGSPFDTLDPLLDHVGDGFADDNYVYAPLSDYLSNNATVKGIAIYNVSDLTLHSYFNLDAQTMLNASGCCLSQDGTEILVTSYFREISDNEKLRDIYRINKTTGAFIGIHTLNYQVTGIQSITTDGTDYYLGAWRRDAPDSSSIYRFNSSFEILSIIDPSEDKVEMEGVEYYGSTLYFNKKLQATRVLDYNSIYDANTTVSNQPIEFLGGGLVTEQNTILIKLTPKTFFNFSTVVASYEYADDWESWIYSDGRLAWRVNSPTSIYPGLTVNTEVIVAVAWDNNAGTVTQKTGHGGIWGTTNTAVWIAPPALGLNLQAGHEDNNFGNNAYSDVIVFDKVLSDAELLSATNNFDDFYVPEGSGGVVIPQSERIAYWAIANYLRSTGQFASTQVNDIIVEWLKSEGNLSSSFNDLLVEYWGGLGLKGAYNDRWKSWKGE